MGEVVGAVGHGGVGEGSGMVMLNESGRRNRVRPDGQLEAVADRGLFWGNRGQLLNTRGELQRHSNGRLWICCVLEFHGRHRTQWRPARLTELYFLDEATALAAGHRPCGECRYQAYQAFKSAWIAAFPGEPSTAADIDRHLHRDRLESRGMHRTYEVAAGELATLPDGVMVDADGATWLLLGNEALEWTRSGYTRRRKRTAFGAVKVRTPRATVDVLTNGYRPVLHPSAQPF